MKITPNFHRSKCRAHDRNYCHGLIDEAIFSALERAMPLAIVVFSVDNFEDYVHTQGRRSSEKLLQVIETTLERGIGEFADLARYWNEDFIGILPEVDTERVLAIVERTCKQCGDIVISYDGGKRITVCAGISTFPHDGKSAEELICNAYRALWMARRFEKEAILLNIIR